MSMMSSTKISSSSFKKIEKNYKKNYKSNTEKYKEIKMFSKTEENKENFNENKLKPNMPANAGSCCANRLSPSSTSSTPSTSVSSHLKTVKETETVLPPSNTTQNLHTKAAIFNFKNSFLNSKIFRTSAKAKFCLSVLILLGAIAVRSSHAIPLPTRGYDLLLHTPESRQAKYTQLLQEQRSIVRPTHRHHRHHLQSRSLGNEDNGSELCKMLNANLKDQIEMAMNQAHNTFGYMNLSLHEYTEAKHNEKNVFSFYNQWKLHKLDLRHPYQRHIDKIRDLNIKTSDITSDKIHLWNKPITIPTLQNEFIAINKSLKIIEHIYEDIYKTYDNDHRDLVEHELRRGNEPREIAHMRFEKIKNFLEDTRKNLMQDVLLTGNIISKLKVPTNEEEEEEFPVTYNQVQHYEWQLLVEHLALMKYLAAMYKYILDKCPE